MSSRWEETLATARTLGLTAELLDVRSEQDVRAAFDAALRIRHQYANSPGAGYRCAQLDAVARRRDDRVEILLAVIAHSRLWHIAASAKAAGCPQLAKA